MSSLINMINIIIENFVNIDALFEETVYSIFNKKKSLYVVNLLI